MLLLYPINAATDVSEEISCYFEVDSILEVTLFLSSGFGKVNRL